MVVGTQSVGGGSSTLYLMRRELVEKRRWLTEREFLEDWAFSKISLGINLIAMSALITHRLAGMRGIVVGLVAMLVPAAFVTALMTAGYEVVRDEPLVRSALAGAGPVTAGMAVGLAYAFARQSVRRGKRALAEWSYWAVVIATGLFASVTPTVVILVGIAVGFLFLRGEPSRASADPGS
ncbi:MAG: chromate transporter [Chloroflexota bacterium]|nr:chromate transporter [Chloroflexota bacterium]MDE3192665.1 chromate transporter [Chloroflexota bacterium]